MGGRTSRSVQGQSAILEPAADTTGRKHHHQRGKKHFNYRSRCHSRDTWKHDARYDAGCTVYYRTAQQSCGTTYSIYLLMAGRKHQP